MTFLDVSGGRDERVSVLLEHLRLELFSERQPSPLFIHSLAQALAYTWYAPTPIRTT